MSHRLFPHASQGGPLKPVKSFKIGNRRLSLYWHENRVPSAAYSLYWDDERNPVQHAMTDREVFEVLAGILERDGDLAEAPFSLENARARGAKQQWITRDGFTKIPQQMLDDLNVGDGANIWFLKDGGRWQAWTEQEITDFLACDEQRT